MELMGLIWIRVSNTKSQRSDRLSGWVLDCCSFHNNECQDSSKVECAFGGHFMLCSSWCRHWCPRQSGNGNGVAIYIYIYIFMLPLDNCVHGHTHLVRAAVRDTEKAPDNHWQVRDDRLTTDLLNGADTPQCTPDLQRVRRYLRTTNTFIYLQVRAHARGHARAHAHTDRPTKPLCMIYNQHWYIYTTVVQLCTACVCQALCTNAYMQDGWQLSCIIQLSLYSIHTTKHAVSCCQWLTNSLCAVKKIYNAHVSYKDIITCKLIPISNGFRKVCTATLWDFSILETCSASKTVVREIGCNQWYFEMQMFRTDCIISVHGQASRKQQSQSYKNRSFSSISSTNSEQNSPQKPK